jgi:hypothetical protein
MLVKASFFSHALIIEERAIMTSPYVYIRKLIVESPNSQLVNGLFIIYSSQIDFFYIGTIGFCMRLMPTL